MASCISSEYRYTYVAYYFQMQKSTTFRNMPCCVLIAFNRSAFGDIRHLANI